jgi:methionine sulfoxide reductase heme-binding subunit
MKAGRGIQRGLRLAVPIAGLAPLAWLVNAFLQDELGANPVEEISRTTGSWALRLLLLCLAVTPLRRALRWSGLAPLRRSLGLLAFAWACLHVAVYLLLDLGLDASAFAEDLGERPWIAAGFTAFTALLPLAATSTRASMRRLGRHWTRLHRLVHVALVAAVVHFLWLVKLDLREPLLYAAAAGLLLALRLVWWLRGPSGPPPRADGGAPGSMRRSRPACAALRPDPRGHP